MRMEQSIVNINHSMLYSDTGVSGSIPGVGSDRHSILYYWFIPNRNAKQYLSISLVRGSGVLRTKGLDCGSNGRIILGGDEEALVFCAGLLGLIVLVCGGVVPSAV